MIRIDAQHVRWLRDSTGKPFNDLLNRLIRATAPILGIPTTAVLDNSRVNLRDGGVDAQVTVGATSDVWEYFTFRSAWQYKASPVTGLPESKVREEISGASKTYVRSLLSEGYAYRMCIADDESPEKKVSSRVGWMMRSRR